PPATSPARSDHDGGGEAGRSLGRGPSGERRTRRCSTPTSTTATAMTAAPTNGTVRTPTVESSPAPSREPAAMPTLKAELTPADARSVPPGATCRVRCCSAVTYPLNAAPLTARATTATGGQPPPIHNASSAAQSVVTRVGCTTRERRRSEERRVGKEGRARWGAGDVRKRDHRVV